MKTVFLVLEDMCLRDQVKAGLRSFENLRAVAVPKDQLMSLLRQDENVDALIMDCEGARSDSMELLAQAREVRSDLIILAVGQRSQRERLHRLKLQLNIFSYVPLPLDPFDLARRLNRLSEAFQAPLSRT